MLRAMRAEGPRTAVVTMGAAGAAALDNASRLLTIPAHRVRVVDTTGAGDAYHGAFAFGMLHRRSLRWTMRFASVVAALKCRSLGGRKGLPTLREALARI